MLETPKNVYIMLYTLKHDKMGYIFHYEHQYHAI